ncbi:unnamed protein product [Wickerhamomyces anomalus]
MLLFYQLVNQRQPNQSSFLTPPPLLEGIEDIKVIYRHYATLYFVFIVDDQESELGILDLIQAVDEANQEKNYSISTSSALSNATSALSAIARDSRLGWPGR